MSRRNYACAAALLLLCLASSPYRTFAQDEPPPPEPLTTDSPPSPTLDPPPAPDSPATPVTPPAPEPPAPVTDVPAPSPTLVLPSNTDSPSGAEAASPDGLAAPPGNTTPSPTDENPAGPTALSAPEAARLAEADSAPTALTPADMGLPVVPAFAPPEELMLAPTDDFSLAPSPDGTVFVASPADLLLTPDAAAGPAIGPSADTGTQDFDCVVATTGSLGNGDVCPSIMGEFPDLNICNIVREEETPAATDLSSRRRRRLLQAGLNVMLTLEIRLSPLPAANIVLVRAFLQRLRTQKFEVQVVIGATPIAAGTPARAPARLPAIPPAVARAPGPSVPNRAPGSGVVPVPNGATANRTVIPQGMPVPTPVGPGTRTAVTVSNTTTTTTITTFTQIDIQLVQISFVQYLVSQPIAGGPSVVIIITFILPGTTIVPEATLGGGQLGQSTRTTVNGPTVLIVPTTTTQLARTTTSTTTQTSTSTFAQTQTSPTPVLPRAPGVPAAPGQPGSPGSPGTPATPNQAGAMVPGGSQAIRPGVSQQTCSGLNRPSGILPITQSEGALRAGCTLVSSFGDSSNVLGRGNIIRQCCPNSATPTVWANITLRQGGACSRDGGAVGLTLALSKVGGNIYAGSIPRDSSGTFRPGCLLVLNSTGGLVNEVTNPLLIGPYGLACTQGPTPAQDTCFVSNVGSTVTTPSAAAAGRRLFQSRTPAPAPSTAAANPGTIVRFDFTKPTAFSTWDLGTGSVLANGIASNPTTAGFEAGNVAPGQPVIVGTTLYYPEILANSISVVANIYGSRVGAGGSRPGTLIAIGTPLNRPNSVALDITRANSLVVSNAGNGNLVFVTLAGNGIPQRVAPWLVDPTNTRGNVINTVFSSNLLVYVAAQTNTLNSVITTFIAPGLAPATTPPAPPRSPTAPVPRSAVAPATTPSG